MTYTPLVIFFLAFVAATGFSSQDSQSYNSLLSALSAMADQAVVKDRPIYASVLQRELEGLVGSSVSRVKRNDLRKPEKFPSCCGSAEVYEFSEEIISNYPECHPENIHGGEIVGESFNSSVLCLPYQCLARKKGVVDGEGYVLPDAFAKAVSNLYTEDSLKNLAKELAPYCITEANIYAEEVFATSDSEQGCNVAPYWAQYCVDIGIVLECPEELIINNEQCDKIREEILQGFQEFKKSRQIN